MENDPSPGGTSANDGSRQAESSPEAAPTGEAPRFLVVEDDTTFQLLLRRILQKQGWAAVDFCISGEEAAEKIRTVGYDLALVDQNLPGIGGVEVLRKIKEELPDTEVLMMTANPEIQRVLDAMGEGAYDYLVKPFESVQDVAHRIRLALQKRAITLENRRLIAELREANEKVTAANRDLEAKVKERTEELQELTLTDDVTGLYNQRFLFTRLEEECRRASRYEHSLSFIMIDVDHFKQVNDEHDHLYGSLVLKRVGELLKGLVREIDSVVRYGGDEFSIIMPETDLAGAQLVADRLLDSVRGANVATEEDPYQVTFSIGVADLSCAKAPEARDLIRAADLALYQAKEGGRNQVCAAPPRVD